MIPRTLLLLCPLLVGCATWRTSDRWLGAAAVGTIATDCGTTIYLLQRGGWEERNPILGPHPDPLTMGAACSVAAVGTLAVADALPRNGWRTAWLGTIVAVEALIVLHNLRVITFNPWHVLR